MVYELVTWLQTDMDAVDEGHLSAALETVVPASAVEGAAGGLGEQTHGAGAGDRASTGSARTGFGGRGCRASTSSARTGCSGRA